MSKLKRPALLKKPNFRSKKKISVGILVVLIVAVGGWMAIGGKDDHKGEKVYAEAAGHKVYKAEIDEFIGKNKGQVTEHQAAQVLADKYLTEALAKERGITVTDKELVDQFDKDTLKQKTTYKYAYQNKLNQVYLSKLGAYNKGVYKGKFLIANFSQNVQAYPTLPEDKARNPDLGNPKAIARDKKYAQDFITGLYKDIKSGKITFDQAIQKEHDDPVVGEKAYPELEHSGSFDTTFRSRDVISSPSIREKINSIKAGETTEPFVVRVNNSLADSNSTAESYFLVVKMDATSGSYTGTSLNQYIDQAKKRVGYGVYI